MIAPNRGQCLILLRNAAVPPHIQNHCFVVAELAVYLGSLLNEIGSRLDLQLLEAGALLHDIAKAQTLGTGTRHEDVGAQMLDSLGYSMVSTIIRDHVNLNREGLEGPLTESLIVNYADKRVKHDQLVSLEARFVDLIQRYGRSPDHRAWLEKKLILYLCLERRIFEQLPLEPESPELLIRCRPKFDQAEERSVYHEEEQADRGIVVWRDIR